MTYAGATRPFVRAWKERGLRPAATLAAELLAEVVPRPAANVITYIPPDGDRSLKRGHHPAEHLARELAVLWQLDTVPLLVRARPVRQQTGLPLRARRANMRGAFAATGAPPRAVVVVDDVYTSGATVGSAASALRSAGAVEVHVVTFARAVR